MSIVNLISGNQLPFISKGVKFAGAFKLSTMGYVANSPHHVYRYPLVEIEVGTGANGRLSGKAGKFARLFGEPKSESR